MGENTRRPSQFTCLQISCDVLSNRCEELEMIEEAEERLSFRGSLLFADYVENYSPNGISPNENEPLPQGTVVGISGKCSWRQHGTAPARWSGLIRET